jgi:hypothetical protein
MLKKKMKKKIQKKIQKTFFKKNNEEKRYEVMIDKKERTDIEYCDEKEDGTR